MKAHFDLEAVERSLRASNETTVAEALALAPDAAGRRLVELQASLSDVRIGFILASLRAVNDGVDLDDWLEAAGLVLGGLIVNLVENAGIRRGPALQLVMESLLHPVRAGLDGTEASDCHTVKTMVQSMPSGTA